MTTSKFTTQYLTQNEWDEMDAIRKAINDGPASVHPEKMEEFTEYFVRSLKERGM